jgi:hypothetical protein
MHGETCSPQDREWHDLQSCHSRQRNISALAAAVSSPNTFRKPSVRTLQIISSDALSTAPCLCEPTMNSTCGKSALHPRIKPVIAGDTTCSVSPLTDTISGSNFAFP